MAVCEGRALNLPDVGVRASSSSGAGSIGDPTTRPAARRCRFESDRCAETAGEGRDCEPVERQQAMRAATAATTFNIGRHVVHARASACACWRTYSSMLALLFSFFCIIILAAPYMKEFDTAAHECRHGRPRRMSSWHGEHLVFEQLLQLLP